MLAYSAMAGSQTPPDYELADRMALTTPAQVKALSHPMRNTILGLLHERAATVTELATALGRPKSTVAHHVKVLTEANVVYLMGIVSQEEGDAAAEIARTTQGAKSVVKVFEYRK